AGCGGCAARPSDRAGPSCFRTSGASRLGSLRGPPAALRVLCGKGARGAGRSIFDPEHGRLLCVARQEPQNYIRRVPAFRHLARIVLVAALALGAASAFAATKRYTFEIPDRTPAAYEVSFDVRHPGKLVIDTRWNGGRVLSFRLE